MTVVGHCTYAYACVVRVNRPLSVRCFILFILGFSIPAFNFQHFGILAFSNTHQNLLRLNVGIDLFYHQKQNSHIICK